MRDRKPGQQARVLRRLEIPDGSANETPDYPASLAVGDFKAIGGT